MTDSSTTKANQPWIRPLPERLVNKIAAGEVVERPASVVKELVENALDSGATRIDVQIEQSGVRSIKIVDDGCGIDPEQIEIAFSRHATSKIAKFEDLESITSYGFRGEALPSIASVSRTIMVSRPNSIDHGIEVVYEGGVLQSRKVVPAPAGTAIEVEELFHNTPARRKFLKSEATEGRRITRTCTAMAMARPDVGFSYRLNGRKVFALPAKQSLRERVTALLAPGKKMVEISGQSSVLAVNGYIGPPDLAQKNRNGQYLFINGRHISSPVLSHAHAAGYGELLPKGNFPIGALLIEVEPADIDVNVHPSKTEVKLRNEREIHDSLYRLVRDGLLKGGELPSLAVPASSRPFATASSGQVAHSGDSHAGKSQVIPGIASQTTGQSEFLREVYRGTPASTPPPGETITVDPSTGEIVSEPSTPTGLTDLELPEAAGLHFLGQFDDLYLIFQHGGSLLLVDQHTAHERVLFEEVMQQLDQHSALSQHLLLPVNVEMSAQQLSVFEEAYENLKQIGFVAELFGSTTVRIEALPAVLSKKSPEKVLRSVVDDIASLKKSGYDLKKAIAESMACRAAVMSGDRLTPREASGLVERLLKCENRFSCPHGRPTLIRLTRADLDKQFGRG